MPRSPTRVPRSGLLQKQVRLSSHVRPCLLVSSRGDCEIHTSRDPIHERLASAAVAKSSSPVSLRRDQTAIPRAGISISTPASEALRRVRARVASLQRRDRRDSAGARATNPEADEHMPHVFAGCPPTRGDIGCICLRTEQRRLCTRRPCFGHTAEVPDSVVRSRIRDELHTGTSRRDSTEILAVVIRRIEIGPGPGRVTQFPTYEPRIGLEVDVVSEASKEVLDRRQITP